jgi:Tfp pilus assembly PilM family ATPase
VPDYRLEILMDFEIREVAEQSGGDVSAAYSLLDVDDATSGDNVVVVALAKNGYLKPRLDATKAAGLDVAGGVPNAVGAYWSYKENGHLRFDETVLLMHIGNENTDVAVARKGALLYARNISGGSKLFTDAIQQNMRVNFPTAEKLKITKGNLTPRGQAKYRDSGEEKIANNIMGVGGHFVSAFNSTVMFAKAQTKVPDCKPDRLVLMGAGAMLRGLPEYMESNLGVPVELFDPLEDLDLSALTGDAQNALRQEQGAAAVALGLAQIAINDEAPRVFVLPEADRKKRHFMQHTMFTILAGALLAIGLVVSFVMSSSALSEAEAENAELKLKKKTFDANLAAYVKAKNSVEKVGDQKYKLRRLVALGPAFAQSADAVQRVIGEGGFDEVFMVKASAKMKDQTVVDAKSGDTEFEPRPECEFEALIHPGGERQVQDAHRAFGVRLQAEVNSMEGFSYEEIGGLSEEKGGSARFKFRIKQDSFPVSGN